MTTEQKAKAYDKVSKEVKDFFEGRQKMYSDVEQTLEYLFPELKENEDEKIRKWLVGYFHQYKEDGMEEYANGLKVESIIAWLEKQGSQKLANSAKTCKDEQKSADTVEPKFKVGDWVILTAGELSATLQIVDVDTNKRLYWFNDSSYLPIVDEECLHPWTINDAKDGDVLVDKNGCINIYKEPCGKTFYYSHGYCYYPNHGYMYEKDGKFVAVQTAIKIEDANPATKEQRDTLMKAMADAGYMFDFEKKELKKVEQKHAAWSEEDEKLLDNTIRFIENCVAATSPSLRTYNPILTGKEIPFLKSLKDRVQPRRRHTIFDEII